MYSIELRISTPCQVWRIDWRRIFDVNQGNNFVFEFDLWLLICWPGGDPES